VVVEKENITREEVNQALERASKSELAGILDYCELPLVSSDFNGSSFSSIVDAMSTDVIENMVKIYAWYDNEAGYAHRLIDLAALVGKSL
jgi:glyceraldehyde 3-phosphate dehydrogenase